MAEHFALKCEASLYGHWGELGGYQREEIHRGAAQAMAEHFAIKVEGLSSEPAA
jgi:hypothetical protein